MCIFTETYATSRQNICNIRLKRMKHLNRRLQHISVQHPYLLLQHIYIKHLQYNFKTFEILEHIFCNVQILLMVVPSADRGRRCSSRQVSDDLLPMVPRWWLRGARYGRDGRARIEARRWIVATARRSGAVEERSVFPGPTCRSAPRLGQEAAASRWCTVACMPAPLCIPRRSVYLFLSSPVLLN
jgi:hypothetical protein